MSAMRVQQDVTLETVQAVSRVTLGGLVRRIVQRPQAVRVWTSPGAPRAVLHLLRGIIDWLTDAPTIEGGMVEDLARAIEKCGDDREALRDLSVQVRNLALFYQPRPERVAPTEFEAHLLHILEHA